MKNIFIAFLCCLLALNTHAQYTNSTSMSTYADLSSPVSLNGGSVWGTSTSYPIYLPFNFSIYGQGYTAVNVLAGGGLNFPGLGVKELSVFYVAFVGGYYLKDKGTATSLSPIGYTITGGLGNHVLKVQWKNAGFKQVGPTVDPTDYVNFQVWLFESDNHIEIHFGPSSTSITTYGGPGSAPGTELIFLFNSCSDLFAISGPCNLPSYSFISSCMPFGSNIDGTPNSGIVYNIRPTGSSSPAQVKTSSKTDLALYPNPADNYLLISGLPNYEAGISITNTLGRICFEKNMTPASGNVTIPVHDLVSGVYYISIRTENGTILNRAFIKQ